MTAPLVACWVGYGRSEAVGTNVVHSVALVRPAIFGPLPIDLATLESRLVRLGLRRPATAVSRSA